MATTRARGVVRRAALATALAAVVLCAGAEAAGKKSSKTKAAPTPSPQNCRLSAWQCGPCAGGSCADPTGARTCTRGVIVEARYGGTCALSTSQSESKTEACEMTLDCDVPSPPPAPPSPPAPPTAAASVAFDLVVRPSDVALADRAGTLQAVRAAVAAAAGVDTGDVAVFEELWAEDTGAAEYSAAVDLARPGGDAAASSAVELATMLRVDVAAALSSHGASFAATDASGIALTPSDVGRCPTASTVADAEAAIGTEDYELALTHLVRVNECILAADEPDFDADVYNWLGYANRMKATPDFAKSELYYDRALQVEPGHLGAHEYLAELYLQTGRHAQARQQRAQLQAACAEADDADCAELDELDAAFAAHGVEVAEPSVGGSSSGAQGAGATVAGALGAVAAAALTCAGGM